MITELGTPEKLAQLAIELVDMVRRGETQPLRLELQAMEIERLAGLYAHASAAGRVFCTCSSRTR